MRTAIVGLVGVIIGGAISMITSIYISNKNIELEKIKMHRDSDFERLNFLLKPLMFVYMKSDDFFDYLLSSDVEIIGKGLYKKQVDELEEIIESNQKLITIKLQSIYLSVNNPDNLLKFLEERKRARQADYDRAHGKKITKCFMISYMMMRENL